MTRKMILRGVGSVEQPLPRNDASIVHQDVHFTDLTMIVMVMVVVVMVLVIVVFIKMLTMPTWQS